MAKTVRQSASVAIIRGGKILMQDRAFPPAGLDLIGGHIDPGETPEQAAMREAKEEADVDVHLVRKICEYTWEDKTCVRREFVFEASIVGGELADSNEGKLVWLPLAGARKAKLAFPIMFNKFLDFYESTK